MAPYLAEAALPFSPLTSPLFKTQFEGSDIRSTDRNGDPWFVAADAARLLGYDHTPHLTRLVEDDEKGVHKADTPGGRQEVAIISEPGLLRAISQRRVTAGLDPDVAGRIVRFQRWLYHDVLPSIRRTGSYQPHQAPAVTIKTIPAREVQSTFKAWHGMAKAIGLEGNMALIAANQATMKQTGVNPLAVLGQTHLIADVQDELLTATQIGERIGGLSGRMINQRLAAFGFHEHLATGWVPTDKGERLGLWQDTSKRQGDGTPIRQWKWFGSIVEQIRGEPRLALVDAVEVLEAPHVS